MGVSKNRGTPKSSISIGSSTINHPYWNGWFGGSIIFGNTHITWLKKGTFPASAFAWAPPAAKMLNIPPFFLRWYVFFSFQSPWKMEKPIISQRQQTRSVGGWTNPSEKILVVKLDHFPNLPGGNKKYLKPPPSHAFYYHSQKVIGSLGYHFPTTTNSNDPKFWSWPSGQWPHHIHWHPFRLPTSNRSGRVKPGGFLPFNQKVHLYL